ncbi:MAG TPA: nuclear transport factor 2 family protein [Saprospiraceae bacterium]|nr:nuclear transport factor 2 family protein [Saprospiraceae bacterium]
MTYKEKAADIYKQLGEGKLLDAFDKYYADNVVMTEPRGTREGKKACRDYEVQFLNSIQEFHGLDVKSVASDEANKVTFVQSMMDVTFKDGNRAKMDQVAVQKWEGDQIVHEEFYYES